MSFGVDPLSNPVIAVSDVADGGPVSLGTFMTLPVLQSINRKMNSARGVFVDFILVFFMIKTIFECMGPLAGAY